MNSIQKRKVFILGLDGATFDLIYPFIEEGVLPNLASIIKEGVRAKLNSTILSHSPPAWTSFATGKNPGKHGILGFTRMASNSYSLELIYGSHNRAKTMWEVLSERGGKVIVMNIPMTYPPKKVNGLLISGLDAPSTSSQFTYPPELREEILSVAPDYKINLHLGGYLHTDKRRIKALDFIVSATKARAKVVLHLMKKYPWDLFAVRFNSPDNVQHQFWRFMDKNHPLYKDDCSPILKNAIKTVYKELDNVVGLIYENIDEKDTAFIIMSDHGAGPRTGKSFFVNEWLRSSGYLSKLGEDSKNKLSSILDDIVFVLKGKILSFLLRTIPPELKSQLMKLVPFAASKTATYLRFSSINWAKTKAFAGEVEGIRLNIKDKYPQGLVDAEEYEGIRSKIIDELKRLRDTESGQNIFKGVFRREEIFYGNCVEEFPDIILKPEDRYYLSPKFFRKKTKENKNFLGDESHWRKISGSHRQYGIFIIKGPDCNSGIELGSAEIIDIFPTVFYQMGLPIPNDIDGKVIQGAFRKEFIESNPLRFEKVEGYGEDKGGDIYSEDEKSKLLDSLKGLGYIG
ncbi:MAG: alkaline phosphatase family protein [Thermodesulfovibrionales bacterium]